MSGLPLVVTELRTSPIGNFVPMGDLDGLVGRIIALPDKPLYDPKWGEFNWPVNSAD